MFQFEVVVAAVFGVRRWEIFIPAGFLGHEGPDGYRRDLRVPKPKLVIFAKKSDIFKARYYQKIYCEIPLNELPQSLVGSLFLVC